MIGDFQCSMCLKNYTFDEYIKLLPKYVREDRKGGKTIVCTCGNPFHANKWQILTKIDNYTISTVHLEIAVHSNEDFLSQEDLYYETMIIKPDGNLLGFQTRYKSKDQAIEGHRLAIKMLPKILLNPDKYPQSILDGLSNALRRQEK